MPSFPVQPAPPGAASPRVVLVEDDLALSNALAFALGLEGFDVRAHRSASTVRADEMPGSGCLVIDYLLPGENGLGLLERLRQGGVFLPAILITSHANARIRHGAETLCASIVEKPLLGDALILAIREAMRSGGAK